MMGILKKDGEVQLVRSCKKSRSVAKSDGGEGYLTCNKKKGDQLDVSHLA